MDVSRYWLNITLFLTMFDIPVKLERAILWDLWNANIDVTLI
jgi:hypothetical protein